MSEDLARQKRIQAGLSLGGAALGLSALGTKGGAVAARTALKRAPGLSGRLRITPKAAEKADKASIGLVTTASGVGGASGIHFARLQQAEAKKEDRVSKSAFGVVHKNVVDMESRRLQADQHRAKLIGQRAHRDAIAAGRFKREGDEPDYKPSTPQRNTKPAVRPLLGVTRHKKDFGGVNPEARRQRRMQGEQAGLAGAAGASAVAAGAAEGRNLVLRDKRKKLTAQAAKDTARAGDWEQLRNRAAARNSTWRGAQTKSKNKIPKQPQNADYWNRQVERQGKFADRALGTNERSHARATSLRAKAASSSSKAAAMKIGHGKTAALGLAAVGMAGGSAAIHRSRKKGQGRKYTDWWDG